MNADASSIKDSTSQAWVNIGPGFELQTSDKELISDRKWLNDKIIHEGLWLAQTLELCIDKGCLSTRSEDTSDELGEREWTDKRLSGRACT